MGLIYTEIELSNPKRDTSKPISVNALVDTGAMMLCIPEYLAAQLRLQEIEKREVVIANARSYQVSYVGPIQVKFANRTCFTGALVLGDTVLMGAVPMEDMDLVICPSTRTITVNPASPDIPSAIVKFSNTTRHPAINGRFSSP